MISAGGGGRKKSFPLRGANFGAIDAHATVLLRDNTVEHTPQYLL